MIKLPTEIKNPGSEFFSPAARIGERIAEEIANNRHFYLFSPDETTSNKLDAAYNVSTRLWNTTRQPWDLPESDNGQIVELLSENTLFAAMSGHILGNHEPAMMTSYEAFFNIITSQIIQHTKFLQQSLEVSWRNADPYPAANLLSTSTCWRQDHNGFSHQTPALISTLLSLPSGKVNCLFPADDISADAAFDFMMNSENVVNLTTFNKTDEPRWIDKNHAAFQYENGGASLYGFASVENPNYIFTAAGDIATRETLYAIEILKQDLGLNDFRPRFIGITALTYGAIGTTEKRLSSEKFDELFSDWQPIIANFHGYPQALHQILSSYTNPNRIRTFGFQDQGSTTTPFEMLRLNHASRYDLALSVARDFNRLDLIEKYERILSDNAAYAREHGIDMI